MSRQTIYCCSCDRPILNGPGQALPVSTNCDIVANDYPGEWAGKPACRTCYDVHSAAGPLALEAHVKATETLRKELEESRRVLIVARDQILRGMEEMGL